MYQKGVKEKVAVRAAVGPSRSIPAAQLVKRSHLSSYTRFVEVLLGAAASLETSYENPAAWKCCMRASMHAEGMTSVRDVSWLRQQILTVQ